MDIKTFNERFGPEMRVFKNTPLFEAIVSVLEQESPSRKTCGLSMEAMTQFAPATLGVIAGYYSPIDIMVSHLGRQEQPPEQAPDFTKSPEELFTSSNATDPNTPPPMKPRKTSKK